GPVAALFDADCAGMLDRISSSAPGWVRSWVGARCTIGPADNTTVRYSPGSTPCASSRVQAAAHAFFNWPDITPAEVRSKMTRCTGTGVTAQAASQSARA